MIPQTTAIEYVREGIKRDYPTMDVQGVDVEINKGCMDQRDYEPPSCAFRITFIPRRGQ